MKELYLYWVLGSVGGILFGLTVVDPELKLLTAVGLSLLLVGWIGYAFSLGHRVRVQFLASVVCLSTLAALPTGKQFGLMPICILSIVKAASMLAVFWLFKSTVTHNFENG